MKLVEKFVYSFVLFLFLYVVVSLSLRLFSITSDYNSHLIGGIFGLFIGFGLFMYLLIVKD